MNFDSFQTEWLGKRVDYNHIYSYSTTDLILQYLYEYFGLGGVTLITQPATWWSSPGPRITGKFHKVPGSQAEKGDIVIATFLGIASGNTTDSDVEVLHQTDPMSADQQSIIKMTTVPRAQVIGLLRPKTIEEQSVSPLTFPLANSQFTPVKAPIITPTIDIERPIDTFLSADSAYNHLTRGKQIPPGIYQVIRTADNGMKYIAKTIDSVRYWINPIDMTFPQRVIVDTPPRPNSLPNQWKQTYTPFHIGRTLITQPEMYEVETNYTVSDISGAHPNQVKLTKGQRIPAYGRFSKDGITYYRVRLARDTEFKYWFGIPIFDHIQGKAILVLPLQTTVRAKVLKVKDKLEDDTINFLSYVPKWFKGKVM